MKRSLYDLCNSPGDIAGIRMIEWFCGYALNTERWSKDLTDGNCTAEYSDEIDGGVALKTGTDTNDVAQIDQNFTWQYNIKGCAMIFVAKRLASAGSRYDIGFQTGYPNSQYVAHIRNNTNDTYYRLITSAGTTSNATDFSIAEDNDFHTGKIINKERSVLGYLDGVLEATNTTNIPQEVSVAGMGSYEPFLKCTHNASAVAETRVTYLEVWET